MTKDSEPRFLRVLIRLVLIGASLGTVLAFFSRWFWIAELFSHFRLYYLLAQALLLLVCLYRRHPVMLAITVVLMLPNIWWVGPYLLPLVGGGPSPRPAGPVTLVSVNLDYRNGDHQSVREYLDARSPDVLVLQEFTPRWQAELASLREIYPYGAVETREGPFGMALYSRLPLGELEFTDLGMPDTSHVTAVIEPDGRALRLIAVHLYPPTTPDAARRRNRQLELLAKVAASGGPVLVVGDLNTTPFSPYFRRLLDQAGLVDARRPQGIHVTWPTHAFPAWIPIDHCLASDGVAVASVHRGPHIGPDHFPLEITLGAWR